MAERSNFYDRGVEPSVIVVLCVMFSCSAVERPLHWPAGRVMSLVSQSTQLCPPVKLDTQCVVTAQTKPFRFGAD